MSLLGRSFASENASPFTPLFHLLDDFNHYQDNTNKHHRGGLMKSFNPKFDVRELGDTYELHGELPGIEQKDIDIEFTDAQTLHIKGRTERTYTAGTPPAGFIDGSHSAGAIEQGNGNGNGEGNGHGEKKAAAHKATVRDESEENADETAVEVVKQEPQGPGAKYWVAERNVGEFSRSFTFPVRVDQDAVKASMKNGILSIVIPKSKKQQSRKITIG